MKRLYLEHSLGNAAGGICGVDLDLAVAGLRFVTPLNVQAAAGRGRGAVRVQEGGDLVSIGGEQYATLRRLIMVVVIEPDAGETREGVSGALVQGGLAGRVGQGPLAPIVIKSTVALPGGEDAGLGRERRRR